MKKLPKGCADRYLEIHWRASSLFNQFVNGNKDDVAEALSDMEPKAALAVLAVMMEKANVTVRRSMQTYLVEVA